MSIAAEYPQEASAPRPAAARVSFFPEIFFSVTVALVLLSRVILPCFVAAPGSVPDYSTSDWLVDYAGGFVRRGLGGAVLRQLVLLTGWSPRVVVMLLTTALYFTLCVYIVRIGRASRGPALWRFALLLNPALLIFDAGSGMVLHKDIVFVAATLLVVALGERSLRRFHSGAVARAPLAFLLLGSVAIVAAALALFHEGDFLFAWLPLNLALVALVLIRLGFARRTAAALLLLAFSPSLLAAAAAAFWHGNAGTAQAVSASWRFALPGIGLPGRPLPPEIDALTWTISRALRLAASCVDAIPVYLAFFLLSGSIVILTVRRLIPGAQTRHLLASLLVPFIAALPLFALGEDWGRWLFLVTTSSLLAMLSDTLRPAVFLCLPRPLQHALSARLAPPIDNLLLRLRRAIEKEPWLFGFALLMFPNPAVPHSWAGFLLGPFSPVNPLYAIAKLIATLLHL